MIADVWCSHPHVYVNIQGLDVNEPGGPVYGAGWDREKVVLPDWAYGLSRKAQGKLMGIKDGEKIHIGIPLNVLPVLKQYAAIRHGLS